MTTKLVVNAGICGRTATINVVGLPDHRATVTVTSDCEMVNKMGEKLKELNWLSLWKRRGDGYSAYKAALQSIKDITCPVPVAILKAIEVEAGIALPKDVGFSFKAVKSGQE